MSRLFKTTMIVLTTAVVLAGCGVRGALERPTASADDQPAVKATASADSGQGKGKDAAPKPHQGFVLDSLLQ